MDGDELRAVRERRFHLGPRGGISGTPSMTSSRLRMRAPSPMSSATEPAVARTFHDRCGDQRDALRVVQLYAPRPPLLGDLGGDEDDGACPFREESDSRDRIMFGCANRRKHVAIGRLSTSSECLTNSRDDLSNASVEDRFILPENARTEAHCVRFERCNRSRFLRCSPAPSARRGVLPCPSSMPRRCTGRYRPSRLTTTATSAGTTECRRARGTSGG